MIYDRIENSLAYLGESKNLDRALRFMVETDLDALPEGRTDIDGDRVFVNVMTAEGREASGGYEYHKKYMDIQIDLKGTERILIGGRVLEELREFTGDIGFLDCEKAADCTMGPGRFIVCRAGEPHMPGVAAGEDRKLKKAVIKVLADS